MPGQEEVFDTVLEKVKPHLHVEIGTSNQQKNESLKEIKQIPERIKDRAKKHILNYSDQHAKVPAQIWLSKKLHLSLAKTTDIMKALERDNYLYKKGTRYMLTNAHGADMRIPSEFDRIKAKVKLSPAIVFMKVILFLVGVGATYMSIYHSTDFLSEYYSPFKAVLAAVIMITFNVLSAEMIIFFHLRSLTVPVAIFSVILVLGTVFSMGSTVIGLYNARAAELTIKYQLENNDDQILKETQLNYNIILSSKQQAEQNLNSERVKRDGLVQILNSYTPEMIEANQDYYNKQNGRRYVADTRVDKAQKILNEIIEKEQAFLKDNTVIAANKKEIPLDAYTWIGGTVFPNVNPASVQFWMSAYPALFYDIIAPVSFSIVFFVGGTINKKKVKKKRKKRRKK